MLDTLTGKAQIAGITTAGHMFIDARQLDRDASIKADVCVIGSGPTGIIIAMELMNSGLSVAVLESGSGEPSASATSLGKPSSDSEFPECNKVWTTRQYGGNANAWHINTGHLLRGVRLLPLSVADFEARPGFEDTGWPISRSDLHPYYVRAQLAFKLPPMGYAPSFWGNPPDQAPVINDADIENAVFQFGDGTTFLVGYRQEIASSRSVSVFLNATALALETSPVNNAVTGVRVASTPGRHLTFRADTYVLATGGLTVPQILLSSNQQNPNGIGNDYGLVGRYFMDHPLILGGDLVPASTHSFEHLGFYDLRTMRDTPIMGFLRLSDRAMRKGGVANLSALLFPRSRMSSRRETGYQAAQRIRYFARHKTRPKAKDWFNLLYGIDGVTKQIRERLISPTSNLQVGGWSLQGRAKSGFTHFEVLHQVEQLPHHDNRVELGDEVDEFGSRRVRISWRWHEADREAVARSQQVFVDEIRRLGLGKFTPKTPIEIKTSSTAHYMGTTRMHENPRRGVVDANCQVHGVPNLFVASASVFPTGGFANPTLTAAALAIRVADAIKRQQSSGIELKVKAFA